MPTTNDLKSRAEARALRKAARDGHVDQAHAEAVALSNVSEAQAAAKTPADPANAIPPKQEDKGVIKKMKSRATQTAIGRRAAEVQAQKDAERTPAPVDIPTEVDRWNGMGNPPLHLLNAAAEQHDTTVRDEGKVVAAAAAKGAYETYVGRIAPSRNRHARMRAQMAAGEAIIAQKAETESK
jgi:hypothetical protein